MTFTKPSRRLVSLAAATAATAVLMSACGSPNQTTVKADTSALEKVYEQIEGLSLEERDAKLAELAEEEGGEVMLYTTAEAKDSDPLTDAFEAKYGIKVTYYRAAGEMVAQKVLQEVSANHEGADLYMADAAQGTVLAAKKALAPLKTPLTERLIPGSFNEYNAAIYLLAPVISWNTDLVKDPPKDLEDALTRFKGKFMIEQEDSAWFKGLVQDYFVKQKKMTEEEAVAYVEDALPGAFVVKGHTLETTLLSSGQAEVCLACYYHSITSAKEDGAPVEAMPIADPVPYMFTSAGLPVTTTRPASALLLLDFLLTDGQQLIAGQNRNPSNRDYQGKFKVEEYDSFPYSVNDSEEDLAKWQGIYEDVLAKAGGSVIDKE
ncbi:hypothetical protein SRB5_44750 [Streptomyces sp. RB5]|uniref:Extracellular solute-binding protein n=1 Tax=Streptomyces smaragdinus TaxID=2585196 RepID=A0A7K0CLL7_9ACTN|nr:extracellular solute-binding protein [Streptomyces smaragdinus]MQY14311.1 hypothetical protein [Streptomyces smaragdinus]